MPRTATPPKPSSSPAKQTPTAEKAKPTRKKRRPVPVLIQQKRGDQWLDSGKQVDGKREVASFPSTAEAEAEIGKIEVEGEYRIISVRRQFTVAIETKKVPTVTYAEEPEEDEPETEEVE